MTEIPVLVVSKPEIPADFVALTPSLKDNPTSLGTSTLATMYGLAHTDGYKNDEVITKIDALIEKSSDPVAEKFIMATDMATTGFWTRYSTWGRKYTPEEISQLNKLKSGEVYGEIPMGTELKPDEEGYVGPIPEDLKIKVLKWISDGINQKVNAPVLRSIDQVGERMLAFDTFIDEGMFLRITQALEEKLREKTHDENKLENTLDEDSKNILMRIRGIKKEAKKRVKQSSK